MRIQRISMLDMGEFDELVEATYGRPYTLQQQDECMPKGTMVEITVPTSNPFDYNRDRIPEIVNGFVMGVSFAAWLARDPKQPLNYKGTEREDTHGIELFWERNFYPSIDMVVNDLHKRGLLEAGEYKIHIDW